MKAGRPGASIGVESAFDAGRATFALCPRAALHTLGAHQPTRADLDDIRSGFLLSPAGQGA